MKSKISKSLISSLLLLAISSCTPSNSSSNGSNGNNDSSEEVSVSITIDEWKALAEANYSLETVKEKYESVTVTSSGNTLGGGGDGSSMSYSITESRDSVNTYDSDDTQFEDDVFTSTDVSYFEEALSYYSSYSITNSGGKVTVELHYEGSIKQWDDVYLLKEDGIMTFGVNGELLYMKDNCTWKLYGQEEESSQIISFVWKERESYSSSIDSSSSYYGSDDNSYSEAEIIDDYYIAFSVSNEEASSRSDLNYYVWGTFPDQDSDWSTAFEAYYDSSLGYYLAYVGYVEEGTNYSFVVSVLSDEEVDNGTHKGTHQSDRQTIVPSSYYDFYNNVFDIYFSDFPEQDNGEVISGGLVFALNEDGESYTVIGVADNDYESDLEIPSSVNGSPVTSIGDSAFSRCTSLTSIAIPDTVTSIGDFAFMGCEHLSSVYINDMTTWLNYSFDTFYSNPLWHGADLYLNRELVTELVIPDGTTSIGDYAFYACESITNLVIPDSVTSLGNHAFYHCINLTSAEIGNNITEISDYTFYATSLTSITIPDSVTKIGSCAFYNCRSLKSVSIPDSVTYIGGYAFSNAGLTDIFIPESVTRIGNDVLNACSSLTSITVDENNPIYHSQGNCLIETESNTLIAGCAGSVIPDDGSVTSIGEDAFMGSTKLTTIDIPDCVTSIGKFAFSGCSKLVNVTIGESVTSIAVYAFYNCKALNSATFSNSTGWYVSMSSTATSGTNIVVSDPSTAANYLASSYVTRYWFRSEAD